MNILTRAAACLERYASQIKVAQTIGDRWDDLDAKAEHDELLELAAALRAEPEKALNSTPFDELLAEFEADPETKAAIEKARTNLKAAIARGERVYETEDVVFVVMESVSADDLRDLEALATRIEMDAMPFGMGDLGAQCCHSLPALKRANAALSPIKEQSDE